MPYANLEKKRENDRAYRESHRDAILANKRRFNDRHRDELNTIERERGRRFTKTLGLWKTAQGCADCSTKDGRLEYHHIDPATKSHSVAVMNRSPLEELYNEIAKCVVLCRKCHMNRHWNRPSLGGSGNWSL